MQPTTTDTEFEAKFYPVNKGNIRSKLIQIQAKQEHPERLMRMQMFNKTFNENMKCDYVRVRDEGDKVTLSAKSHAVEGGELSDQKEVNAVVSDFTATVEILERAGLILGDYQEKLRETWKLGSVEIVIDTWPSLEPYIEIEAPSEKEVKSVAEKLGFSWDKKIITSVIEIYASKYGITADQAHEKIRYATFEKPPF